MAFRVAVGCQPVGSDVPAGRMGEWGLVLWAVDSSFDEVFVGVASRRRCWWRALFFGFCCCFRIFFVNLQW